MAALGQPKSGGRALGTKNKATVAIAAGLAPVVKLPRYRMIAIDRLIPYAKNARTHSAAQISKIAASIREFGFTNPVLTDGKRGIIAGHGRVLAAHQLGHLDVPCIELSHLSAAQRRAYVLADNRLALDAGWDMTLLASELETLKLGELDLALTGFDGDELRGLLGLDDDDDEPPGSSNTSTSRSATCPKCGLTFTAE